MAFAAADLLLEIDPQARITLALGAAGAVIARKEADLIGTDWRLLFQDHDHELLSALQALEPGGRLGPFRLALAGSGEPLTRYVSVSAFRLTPDALSCAVSVGASQALPFERTAEGLLPPQDFEAATAAALEQAEQSGATVRMDLVELKGLRAKADSLGGEESAALLRRVAATLRADSFGGIGASELAPDRFALIRPAGQPVEGLTARLCAVAGQDVAASTAELPLTLSPAGLNARAVRYALDRFIEEGPRAAAGGFMGAVERTVRETDRFRSALAEQSFQLAYQPVISLSDESLHHFEALARFTADTSPAQTIRLAEELELILDFDIAVARKVVDKLAEPDCEARIAVNVSAYSLMQPRFVDELLAIAGSPPLRRRLLLEITETARLDDLASAARIIAHLRDKGFVVCLDDFGAGAASLDYICALTVDLVKVDGRFVRGLTEGSREAVLLKHVVGLCDELGVRTVAEMIENGGVAALVRGLGVTFGQGYMFGKPAVEPVYTPPAVAPVRRQGAVEEWQ
jgi:EAL domain-containing protein (putative c-di-GMP-specific phosphodiesterase class I)